MRDDEYQKIISTYQQLQSITETAKAVGVSSVKVRRVLITEGLWESSTSRSVGRLYREGRSVAEIANLLSTSVGNVQAYIPYSKGTYNSASPSDDANRSRAYRKRKQAARSPQAAKISGESQTFSQPASSDAALAAAKAGVHPIAPARAGNEPSLPVTLASPNTFAPAEDPFPDSPAVALQLHIELGGLKYLNEQDLDILRSYGGMVHSLSRDIIIPARMTLRGLHYIINRLYGWQNSHLHRFSLPEDVLLKMTGDSLENFYKLCGCYFRFSDGSDADLADIYWDNENEENIDIPIKTWLKEKYTGAAAYEYYGSGDHLAANQQHVSEHIAHTGSPAGKSLQDALKEYSEYSIGDLLERLPVGDVLGCISYPSADIEALLSGRDTGRSAELADTLMQNLQNANDQLKEINHLHHDLRRSFSAPPQQSAADEDLLNKYEGFQQFYASYLLHLLEQCEDPQAVPVTNRLHYEYDYGDGWEVEISCTKLFKKDHRSLYQVILDPDTDKTFKPRTVQSIVRKHNPVCLSYDGNSLMDDVGGLRGYVDFLAKIHQNDHKHKSAAKTPGFDNSDKAGEWKESAVSEESENYYDSPEFYLEWAKGMGWTKRMPTAKNML